MRKVTMQITGERLMAMHDNEMTVFVTPGAENAPYWASRPNFQDDYAVGNTHEIIEFISVEYGTDEDELRSDETVYDFEVEVNDA